MTTAIVFVQNEPRMTINGDWLPDGDTFRLERSASQCKAPLDTYTRLEISLDESAEKALAELDKLSPHAAGRNSQRAIEIARTSLLREQVQRQEIERLVKAAKECVNSTLPDDKNSADWELDAARKEEEETK